MDKDDAPSPTQREEGRNLPRASLLPGGARRAVSMGGLGEPHDAGLAPFLPPSPPVVSGVHHTAAPRTAAAAAASLGGLGAAHEAGVSPSLPPSPPASAAVSVVHSEAPKAAPVAGSPHGATPRAAADAFSGAAVSAFPGTAASHGAAARAAVPAFPGVASSEGTLRAIPVTGIPEDPATEAVTQSPVESLFQEYQNRRIGLLKAFNENHDTLLEMGHKIRNDTPYNERLCLWGCEDATWELKHWYFPIYGGCVQPQPLLPFEPGVRQEEWISRMADYSEAWLVAFIMEKAMTLQAGERRKLITLIDDLEAVKFEIGYESLAGRLRNLNETFDMRAEVEAEVLKIVQGKPSACMRSACSYPQLMQQQALIDEWVQCVKCKLWFHCRCVKFSLVDAKTEMFWCDKCTERCATGVKSPKSPRMRLADLQL